jgi:UDP-N-acetylmuramate dehydrogenase
MTSLKSWPCAALATRTSPLGRPFQVGGRARWLLEPATPEELRKAIVAARAEGLAIRILGGGANLIVGDGVLDAVVIATDRLQRVFRPGSGVGSEEALGAIAPEERMAHEAPAEDARVVAWAGVSMPRIVSMTQKLGWTGFEGLVGVPGNVGGGIAMNAGGRWGEMWDVVERVLLVLEDGTLVEKAREECNPAYRNAQLGRAVVASAVLRFRPDEAAAVVERCRDYLGQKKRAQPVTERRRGASGRTRTRRSATGSPPGSWSSGAAGRGGRAATPPCRSCTGTSC